MAQTAPNQDGLDAGGGHKSLRLHGTVARDLGISIVSGHHQPGDVLEGEIEASYRLNVSRTAYREAVRILAAKGLVEARPKTGTRVNPREKWHLLDPDVLSWIFKHEPDDHLVHSLFELRRVVEPAAAQLAAERRTPDQVDSMRAAVEAMAEHTLATEAGRRADQDFHAALLDASSNPFLVSLSSGVGAAVAWTTIFKQRVGPLQRDPVPDHWRVYEAIAAGDPQAAHAAMTQLVDLALLDTTAAQPPEGRRKKRA